MKPASPAKATNLVVPPIPPGEDTPYVRALHALLVQAYERIAQLEDEVRTLRAEVAVLKGHKPQPTFRGSNLAKRSERDDEGDQGGGAGGTGGAVRRRGYPKRAKTAQLVIHETRVLVPENLPEGSKLVSYRDSIVQDLIIEAHNTRYRRATYRTPDGRTLSGELPAELAGGHFGARLVAYLLEAHHRCHVTQPKLLEQLTDWGIQMSAGQLDALLAQGKGVFLQEAADVLAAGLAHCSAVTVDDTGMRHAGANGYVLNISSESFAWFGASDSKSRHSFLEQLHGQRPRWALNDEALSYMAEHGLAPHLVAQLRAGRGRTTEDAAGVQTLLDKLGIVAKGARLIVEEGLLHGGLTGRTHPKLAIVSDGAGQFDTRRHGACWVHAERLVHRLVPATDAHRAEQDRVRADIWQLYRNLQSYRRAPVPKAAQALRERFDQVFQQPVSFEALGALLERLHERKGELLLVLERLDVPLHTNQSESDIRSFVTKRKVSGGTRSELGRRCRSAFATLAKTTRKLDVSFWQYLLDRLQGAGAVAPLSHLIAQRAAAA